NKNGVSSNDQNGASKTPTEPVDQKVVKEGIFTRFKNTYKQHGKIFIGVHLVTSAMWTGMFYYAVVSGVDVVAMLDWLGVSQTVIDKLKSPSLGYIAATYLLYKLATPLRYTVTIVGTRWVVKYLQKSGKMPATPEENKISSLLKE
ncbi:hypothetical protein HELRODRAFT_124905, partial [Helobdella robusta]|uniref:DUF1279 domain-containing protein n=1 Tax=Helobdella robusta TaxID=6412 RepID=T1EH34_HELRO